MRKVWKRIRLVFKVRKFGPFLMDFFKSGHVSFKKKLLSAGLIIGYFLLPIDLIPDFLTMFGLIDDVGILLFVFQQIIKLAPDSLRQKHGMEIE
ncbi:hypothetical protein AM500_11835 [Bacillus sp. FJAT-18017]|uniref:YkvA family protein n=1 Tax=Bacillus sp. FJAT-18017 TaxID=1705566 RepID=UPI0006AE03F5|nr:DUF1232 domain-containing protein [Bacillus sp. FJAT-18017]ALC90400.1 hypothetical protein AM500_11835 [Bacillus sp. FJAT-18017]